eukprot:5835611-Amphidinium_carterae.1
MRLIVVLNASELRVTVGTTLHRDFLAMLVIPARMLASILQCRGRSWSQISQLSLVALGRIKTFDPAGLQKLLSCDFVASAQTKVPALGANKAALMNSRR